MWHKSSIICPDFLCSSSMGYNACDPYRAFLHRTFSTGDLIGSRELHATKDHERQHWFQFISTTFGNYLLFLDRTSTLIATHLVTKCEKNKNWRTGFSNRLRQHMPVIQVDDMGDPDYVDFLMLGESDHVGQGLYCAHLTQRLWLDSASQWHVKWPHNLAVTMSERNLAMTLSDYGFDIESHGTIVPGLEWARTSSIVPITVAVRSEKGSGGGVREITTRHVMECGAVIAELYDEWSVIGKKDYISFHNRMGLVVVHESMMDTVQHSLREKSSNPSSISIKEYAKERIENVISKLFHLPTDRYWLCLQYALQEWERFRGELEFVEHFCQIAMSIVACCDIALNPPIYIFHRKIVGDYWLQTYPPARFQAVIQAVSRCGLLSLSCSEDEFSAYCLAIAEDAGLVMAPPVMQPFGSNKYFDANLLSGEFSHIQQNLNDQFRFVIWCMGKHASFRAKHPLYAALPCRIFMDAELPTAHYLNIMQQPESGWLSCPFLYYHNEQAIKSETPISQDFSLYYCFKLMQDEIMKQVIFNGKNIDLSHMFNASLYKGNGKPSDSIAKILLTQLSKQTKISHMSKIPIL